MKKTFLKALLLTLPFSAAIEAAQYRVTITNMTHAQAFTPILVASHQQGHPMFVPGGKASAELEAVAEGGDIAPMSSALSSSGNTLRIANSDGLLSPGESVSIELEANRQYRYFSMVSMLIPTNDAFLGVSGISFPSKKNSPLTLWVPAFDAGTEENDESCANMPGPVCGGEGYSADDGEGHIYTHQGIRGVGDLDADTYDWLNPAAMVTIEKL